MKTLALILATAAVLIFMTQAQSCATCGCSDPEKGMKKNPGDMSKGLMGDVEEKVTEQPKLVVCQKCGEIKGSEKCCKIDAEKCPKCGLNKGSIGCCKALEPAEGEKDIVLCAKCGEVKGTYKCCKVDAVKCPKCGLNEGSPGCCKLPPKEALAPEAEGKPQTMCPVMGGEINKKYYADHEGKRVYFCCPACKAPFEKDPSKYIEKLEAEGVELEEVPES